MIRAGCTDPSETVNLAPGSLAYLTLIGSELRSALGTGLHTKLGPWLCQACAVNLSIMKFFRRYFAQSELSLITERWDLRMASLHKPKLTAAK